MIQPEKNDYSARIATAVEAKLQELASIPVGVLTGRRLELGGDKAKASEGMRRLFTDIGERVGLHFLEMTPAVLLEQFAIQSVLKDHDTAGLLKSLINSFLIDYATPETNDQAYGHLLSLEALRATVAADRMRTVQTLALAQIAATAPPTKH
jgi:hypothetical protein